MNPQEYWSEELERTIKANRRDLKWLYEQLVWTLKNEDESARRADSLEVMRREQGDIQRRRQIVEALNPKKEDTQ